ncbi:hypothetical protein ACIBFB_01655 [Nocardiopsis sp. NPDC050513]|uniref:hypothetical protein n=1 Tax=Nocardiopsis sp. NPDC050513 TaxID=3364338 RepID=UPI003799CAA9
MSDKSHWISAEPIPTLTCCPYLGNCEITMSGFGCYTWLDGRGVRMYMDTEFPEAVVSEVVTTRAGLPGGPGCLPTPPSRPVPPVPRPRLPPLPRRTRKR